MAAITVNVKLQLLLGICLVAITEVFGQFDYTASFHNYYPWNDQDWPILNNNAPFIPASYWFQPSLNSWFPPTFSQFSYFPQSAAVAPLPDHLRNYAPSLAKKYSNSLPATSNGRSEEPVFTIRSINSPRSNNAAVHNVLSSSAVTPRVTSISSTSVTAPTTEVRPFSTLLNIGNVSLDETAVFSKEMSQNTTSPTSSSTTSEIPLLKNTSTNASADAAYDLVHSPPVSVPFPVEKSQTWQAMQGLLHKFLPLLLQSAATASAKTFDGSSPLIPTISSPVSNDDHPSMIIPNLELPVQPSFVQSISGLNPNPPINEENNVAARFDQIRPATNWAELEKAEQPIKGLEPKSQRQNWDALLASLPSVENTNWRLPSVMEENTEHSQNLVVSSNKDAPSQSKPIGWKESSNFEDNFSATARVIELHLKPAPEIRRSERSPLHDGSFLHDSSLPYQASSSHYQGYGSPSASSHNSESVELSPANKACFESTENRLISGVLPFERNAQINVDECATSCLSMLRSECWNGPGISTSDSFLQLTTPRTRVTSTIYPATRRTTATSTTTLTVTQATTKGFCKDGLSPVMEMVEGFSADTGTFPVEHTSISELACLNACKTDKKADGSTFICQAAVYRNSDQICTMLGDAGSIPIKADINQNYYEKICISSSFASKCNGPIVRMPQRVLLGFNEAVNTTRSLSDCISRCFNSQQLFSFRCKSGMFYYAQDRDNCILNFEDEKLEPSLLLHEQQEQPVDYFQISNCAVATRTRSILTNSGLTGQRLNLVGQIQSKHKTHHKHNLPKTAAEEMFQEDLKSPRNFIRKQHKVIGAFVRQDSLPSQRRAFVDSLFLKKKLSRHI